jgi:hypothetical protein
MSFDAQTLYELLPAVYRIRDDAEGGVLREMVRIIAEQVEALEEDIDQLYDDQFIETCARWVVPYIGDLVGFRDIHRATAGLPASRAEVANTIAYRRRKGTAAMLEQLARDVTGLNASVVEFFKHLAVTQCLNHRRLDHHGTADIRCWSHAVRRHTPFDTLAHTVDVRTMEAGRGRYNIPNMGIFLWRVRSYLLRESPLFQVDSRRYRFHPLGVDMSLYNHPVTETHITHMATADNVPMPLLRRHLAEHLTDQYGAAGSLWLSRDGTPIDVGQVRVCDLSDISGGWANMPVSGVAIDPELGRIAFGTAMDPLSEPLTAGFCYGFPASMGGGGYDRINTIPSGDAITSRVPADHPTIQSALDDAGGSGVIEVSDNGRYAQANLEIAVAQDQQLQLTAANLTRPTVVLSGDALLSGGASGEITLDGLLIAGASLRVPSQVNAVSNRLQRLRLRHCTLVPGIALDSSGIPQQPGAAVLVVETANTEVVLESCIVGGLQIAEGSSVSIRNSIVDATSAQGTALSGPGGLAGAPLTIANSTVIGRVETRWISDASNTLFLSRVRAERIQQGCVRYSYLPPDSRVPRRYRCLPDNRETVCDLQPQFTALQYGHPGYCQLHTTCPPAIRQGADDESEMGAFHDLYATQQETGLRHRLREYLRFGLEVGIFYAS